MIPFDSTKHGTLHQLSNGQTKVEFQRVLNHPIETVWRAITDPDELTQWFPGLSIDLKLGGEFTIRFGGECKGPAHVTGVVEELEPPTRLKLGSMCFELEPAAAGCLLTFSDILWFDERPKTDFAVSVLGGWHAYMDVFCDYMAGKPTDPKEPDYREIEVPGWELLN